MKRLLIVHCLIAVQLLLVCHVFASEQRVFKVGSFDDYPLIFKDKDGTDKGLYVDLLSEIGKKENIKFIYVFGTWNEGLDRIKSGEVDILTDVGYTLERAQYMDYCKNSLLTFWGELYTLKSSEIYGLLDIKDMKIGVLKGDIFAENFLELINKFNITCEIVELQSYNDIFKAISENRVDAGVAAGSFKKDDQKKYGIKSTGFVFSPLDVFFTTGKGKNNELRDLLDKYLNEWKYQENSVFNKAKQQWLYASADTVDVIPGWLINTLFIAGMVFFVGIVFIVILKLQVKRVTSKIIDSEQLIKSISDNLQNGMIYSIIVDPNGFRKFTYLSNSVKLLYGIMPEEGIKDANLIYRTVHEDDINRLMQAEDYALKTLSQLKIEFRIKEPSGKIRWSSIVSTPKKLVNGSICFDGIEFVITEIKTAEKALIDSEIKYRSLIEGSSDVIFCVNEKGEYQFTNMIFATAFGRTPDYFIGKTYWDVYPKEDADRRQVATSRVYKSAISETLEISVPLPNETKYFLAKINPIKNSEGKVIFVLVNSTDITDRKLTEEKLKENNSLIKSIFEADPTGVSLTVDRVFFKANKQFFKITGYSENEIIGQNTRMLYPDEFEYNRVGVKLYDDLMLNGVGSIESKWLRKDGVMIDVQLSISPLDPLNFKSGLTSVVFDISERKQAEREKIKLEAQLHQAQKMESIGRLAGGIAHDFNNMLGVILGHSELAVKYSNVSPELINSLLEIRKAAEHSATLTRQLLAFSRNQTVVPKVLNLNDTVSGMIKMLERLIGEDIKFVWKPDESIWLVKMDPSQVDQILANLCINARDAISGVGAITVETGNSEIDDLNSSVPTGLIPGKYVKISVSDNGCGIDKDNLEHIFEPFFTTKEMGKGTGLGLATVYGAVKQNHGFVNVYSEVGIGTTFTIYLPRYDGHGKTANIESTNPKFQHGKETILLVEDETGILDVTTKMLEIQGYLVIGANNPIDALRLAKEHGGEIRLLITDMIMPEMNGRDLAAKVTTIYPHIKCLFMSGYIANIIVENGILDDDVHFIQKPFTMNDLSVKVREVLDSQKPDSE